MSEAVLRTSSTSLSLKASAFSIASLISDEHHHRRRRHRSRRCSRRQDADDDVITDVTVLCGVTSSLSRDAGNMVALLALKLCTSPLIAIKI